MNRPGRPPATLPRPTGSPNGVVKVVPHEQSTSKMASGQQQQQHLNHNLSVRVSSSQMESGSMMNSLPQVVEIDGHVYEMVLVPQSSSTKTAAVAPPPATSNHLPHQINPAMASSPLRAAGQQAYPQPSLQQQQQVHTVTPLKRNPFSKALSSPNSTPTRPIPAHAPAPAPAPVASMEQIDNLMAQFIDTESFSATTTSPFGVTSPRTFVENLLSPTVSRPPSPIQSLGNGFETPGFYGEQQLSVKPETITESNGSLAAWANANFVVYEEPGPHSNPPSTLHEVTGKEPTFSS